MRFVRPLSDLGSEIRSRAEKIHFGIPSIDRKLKGFRVGEFNIVAGLTHHGKSLLCQTMVWNNRAVPMLWVSPDESRAKVLAQFAATAMGRHYKNDLEPILEEREADGITPTQAAMEMSDEVVEVVKEWFPHLIVIGNQYLTLADLGVAVDEAHEVLGERPKLMFFDYMELLRLPPGADPWNGQADALKEFAARAEVGVVAIHQVKRLQFKTDALDPDPAMLRGGGERQAFSIVWCAREALILQDAGGQPEERQPKVRVYIIKNKNGDLAKEPDGIDCAINPTTGVVEEFNEMHMRRRRGLPVCP